MCVCVCVCGVCGVGGWMGVPKCVCVCVFHFSLSLLYGSIPAYPTPLQAVDLPLFSVICDKVCGCCYEGAWFAKSGG